MNFVVISEFPDGVVCVSKNGKTTCCRYTKDLRQILSESITLLRKHEKKPTRRRQASRFRRFY